MKKLVLAVGILLIGASLKAAPPGQTYSMTRTSFSASAQNATLFSSHTIQFIGVLVSSQSLGGRFAIYRSTESSFTSLISTQVSVPVGFDVNQVGGEFYPLYDMTNTSYTYVQKIGASETTIFFRCVGETGVGVCPGLKWSGQIK